jgi:glycogen debranching enzyme
MVYRRACRSVGSRTWSDYQFNWRACLDPERMSHMEWLEADGLGGFACGTVAGIRTRRYHALLLTAMTPPTSRVVLVNGYDAWVETPTGVFALSSQRYTPGVTHPNGVQWIESFEPHPWPRWTYRLEDGTRIDHELFVPHGSPMTVLSWRVRDADCPVTLVVRPFLSGRHYHDLHHENPVFQFTPEARDSQLLWRPYVGLPGIACISNGSYRHQPDWYRNFYYAEERARGLDDTEDLASPGEFRWDLLPQYGARPEESLPSGTPGTPVTRRPVLASQMSEAVWILAAEIERTRFSPPRVDTEEYVQSLRVTEQQRRKRFPTALHLAADAYVVRTLPGRRTNRDEEDGSTNRGKTIIAGYPWFTDWGRDTFIAMRGLCLATGRLDVAREILLKWAETLSEGMVPNRFPDGINEPEFNSVDASLWYVVAIHEFLRAAKQTGKPVRGEDRTVLYQAMESILTRYAAGTRFGIHVDRDGLLAAGQPGTQLTWMDAKIGEWVVTPRIGKPVEVQALWLNALKIGRVLSDQWNELLQRGMAAFEDRFWNESSGFLYDVVDCDHRPGTVDASCRPNQLFSVGGLPFPLLQGARAQRIVQMVEQHLWTPMGLRSLAPGDSAYMSRYHGGVRERDGAYHQGTVWPWLIGAFVEAWVRVHGDTLEAKKTARERYLEPILSHLHEAGLGHISEIADAEPPHTPGGCPFQAWSLGEVLRLSLDVLTDHAELLVSQPTMPRAKGQR